MIKDFRIWLTRFFNFWGVHVSYFLSISLNRNLGAAMPYALSFEPTNICNLNCPECASGNGSLTRAKGFADVSNFRVLIEKVHRHVFYLNLYFQGEPLLHQNLAKFTEIAYTKHITTVISTNFQYDFEKLKPNLPYLHKLIVSMDGTDEETYRKYRKNGSLAKVLTGLENLTKWKKENKSNRPKIEIQVVVNKFNENQIPEFRKLAKKFEAKLVLKTMQISHDFDGFVPGNDKLSRYRKDKSGCWQVKTKLKNRCYRLWSTAVISWDGRMASCCFDKDIQYDMGNVFKQNFKVVWTGKKFTDFRNHILKNRGQIEICKNCTE
jgi:radical SAM protein with 4Fe4S-binding SPASM domain